MSHPELAVSSGLYWTTVALFVTCLILIVSEKIDKTKVALFGATTLMITSIVDQSDAFYSPHLGIDYNVVFLLIGMMIVVGVLGRSGAFEWTAVKLAKAAKGRPYPILVIFLLLTAVFSAFLDNVTTVLLFAPVTLLIADELEVDPTPFLIVEALASNVGGTATLIGDPPNLIIASRTGLTFMDFIVHLGPAVVVMLAALVVVVHFLFRNKLVVDDARREHIMAMDESKLIRDPKLVKQSLAVLALITVGFVLHGWIHLEPATIALFGAALLLLIADLDVHEIFAKDVEWPTIFFFIGLFIMVGGVVKVGLVGDLSKLVIAWTEPTETSMVTTSLVLLWVSGILSAFLDNIPYVATMAPLVADMGSQVLGAPAIVDGAPDPDIMHHPVLMPVWWALALGSCLGGNGSPIGASANVVVLGLAARSGRPVSFLKFMAYGVPVTILTLAIATVYVYLRYYVLGV
ncbi:MAG: ArsB/NhaD family transporter [Acidobacteriota bacterium]